MNKDIKFIVETTANTALNIAQMFISYADYLRDGSSESRKKLIKPAVMSAIGITSLIAFGIYMSNNNQKKDIFPLD